MSSPSRISQLSSEIHTQTQAIEGYLKSNGLPEPSFKLGAPFFLPLSPDLRIAQAKAVNAAIELLGLIKGPVPHIAELIRPGTHTLTSLHAIHKFRIAHRLEPDEQLSYHDLAQRCGMDESDLRRVVRQSIAWQIFCEPRKGFISHNAVSLAIVETPFLDDYIGASFGILNPAAAKGPDQMQQWPGSQDATHHGYALATGMEGVMFDTLKKFPTQAQNYTNMMSFFGMNPAMNRSNCIRDLGWTDLDIPETIVDVGGGHGTLCAGVLRAFPSIKKGIVQDLDEVVQTSQIPEDLRSRLKFQVHDFLTPQTVQADVYLLRWVLHDWPDPESVLIIRNLLPALKRGSRLIINEMVLPEPGKSSISEERTYRAFDLVMKTTSNAKERDEDEWQNLIRAVDPGLKIFGIRRSPPAMQSVIEVRYGGRESEDDIQSPQDL